MERRGHVVIEPRAKEGPCREVVRVESGEGVPSSEYKKRRYFFCSDRCKHEFERAENDRINAIYDFHKAYAALESAIGRPLR